MGPQRKEQETSIQQNSSHGSSSGIFWSATCSISRSRESPVFLVVPSQ